MLNFKFIKAQFRNVWPILLAFGLVFVILVGIGAFYSHFGPQGIKGNVVAGGATILNSTLFGYESLVLFFVFGMSISGTLINRDISQGYIASWLTSSMSRTTIFNSKLFVLISSTLLYNIWIVILEVLIYGIRMSDFQSVVGPLLVGNLGILLMSLVGVCIPWLVFCIFEKRGWAIGINMAIIGWFALCYILVSLSASPKLDGLKYFKYFTLLSLLNSPLQFTFQKGWEDLDNAIGQIQPLKALDYVWQFPLMLVLGISGLVGGQYLIQRKDFAF